MAIGVFTSQITSKTHYHIGVAICEINHNGETYKRGFEYKNYQEFPSDLESFKYWISLIFNLDKDKQIFIESDYEEVNSASEYKTYLASIQTLDANNQFIEIGELKFQYIETSILRKKFQFVTEKEIEIITASYFLHGMVCKKGFQFTGSQEDLQKNEHYQEFLQNFLEAEDDNDNPLNLKIEDVVFENLNVSIN